MSTQLNLSLRVRYVDKTSEQRFYKLIFDKIGRVPTKDERQRTSMNFYGKGLTIQDFRGFYLSLSLYKRRNGYLGVRNRVRDMNKPLSLDRLLSKYGENKALRYVVRIMCERWWESNGKDGHKWRVLNKNYDSVNIVDLVHSFRIYAGSTIGWHKDMYELMFHTDFLYYNGRQKYLYINPNYFIHWLNTNAYWLMIFALRDNLHLYAIKKELEFLGSNEHNYMSRHGLYRAGQKQWYKSYKELSLKRIPLR
jgi:hypothetical protein